MSSRSLTVMFTDLTGFTKAMSEMSREQIEAFLSAHDRVVRPIILAMHGKVIKTGGDSFMSVFESPTDAVLAGVQIQEAVEDYNRLVKPEEKMEIRVSINVGEVTEKDGDIFGDAVNVASRLLSVAEKNGVYFTEAVYLVMNKKEVPTAEVGYRQFKGVPEKVKVYRVLRETPPKSLTGGEKKAPVSIAPTPTPAPDERPTAKRKPWALIAVAILFAASAVFAVVGLVLQESKPGKTAAVRQPVASPSPSIAQAPVQKPAAKPAKKPAAKPAHHVMAKPKPARVAKSKPPSRREAAAVRRHIHPSPAAPSVVEFEVSSSPTGASVFVDGAAKGRTDIAFPVSTGSHDLRLTKRGYETKEVIVEVKAGERVVNQKFTLEKKEP